MNFIKVTKESHPKIWATFKMLLEVQDVGNRQLREMDKEVFSLISEYYSTYVFEKPFDINDLTLDEKVYAGNIYQFDFKYVNNNGEIIHYYIGIDRDNDEEVIAHLQKCFYELTSCYFRFINDIQID